MWTLQNFQSMKKLLLSLFALGAMSASAQHLYGDLDHDGLITVADEIILRNIILGNAEAEEIDVIEIQNMHEYVDLGVIVNGQPIYWATTNVGAKRPADCGLYFAWGERVGCTEDTSDGLIHDWPYYSSELCGGSAYKLKKYCNDSYYGTVDNKVVLEQEDDAAYIYWGETWRMPTAEEFDALQEQCDWEWTTMTNSEDEEMNGYKVSNKLDASKYIFLPAAGDRNYLGKLNNHGDAGYYWSSSLDESACYLAHNLYFYTTKMILTNSDGRYLGFCVRPVYVP